MIAPSTSVLEAFKIGEKPHILPGGQGETWRAGFYVLKKTSNYDETLWSADLISHLPQDTLRIAKFKKTNQGEWMYDGWFVLEYLQGSHIEGHWEEKIRVCQELNTLLSNIDKPDFIDKKSDPWTIASKMAWSELPLKSDPRLSSYTERIQRLLQPIKVKNQIVHGDLTGNMLFADGMAPGVIDFTPIWRPKQYALAILVMDAITWEGADESIFAFVSEEENMFQILLRAALFRTLVMSEFLRQKKIDRFRELIKHKEALDMLIDKFPHE